jgi:hypothetical protein
VLNDPADYDSWWPITNLNIFTPEGYGVITFGGVDEVPPPPDNLAAIIYNPMQITLEWSQPDINDFDHFNIYWSQEESGTFELLDETVGVQYLYMPPAAGDYYFYVTTVDKAGHESSPSATVGILVVGIDDPGSKPGISMIKLGPNPMADRLGIDIRIEKETRLDIRVVDLTGKTVATIFQGKATAGLQHINWNGRTDSGNSLMPGLYLVRFESGEGIVVTMKMVAK